MHTYQQRTSRSRQLFEGSKKVLPGGDTRSALFFEPYPTFMESGAGCRLVDVDGNVYIDVLNNYTSLVHGHAVPAIVNAISEQASRGTAFAAPTELQIKLASLLSARIPSLERIRFCNSGTEATMMAIRAAKAFTGRDKILKLEGGYHGTHDAAMVGIADSTAHSAVGAHRGVFRGIISDVLCTPANDISTAREIIADEGANLAAIIIELVMGGAGIIPLDKEFVDFLANGARSCGALLILDEVITFRLAHGGAQQIYGIRPDLTALGKIIGGGLPVGAFGGRADVMALFDPATGTLVHSGTFNGNSATMVAGVAALNLLTEGSIALLNQQGDRLRRGIDRALAENGFQGQTTGFGSLVGIHFTKSPVTNYRASSNAPRDLLPELHLSLMNRGMFMAPRGFLCTSTAMTESDIDQLIATFGLSLTESRGSGDKSQVF